MRYAERILNEGNRLGIFDTLRYLVPNSEIVIYGSVGLEECLHRLYGEENVPIFADEKSDLDIMAITQTLPSPEERKRLWEREGFEIRKEYTTFNPGVDVCEIPQGESAVPPEYLARQIDAFEKGYLDPYYQSELNQVYWGYVIDEGEVTRRVKSLSYPEILREKEAFWIQPVLRFTREFYPKARERGSNYYSWEEIMNRMKYLHRVVFALARLPYGDPLDKWIHLIYRIPPFGFLPKDFHGEFARFSYPNSNLDEKVNSLDRMAEMVLPYLMAEVPDLKLEIPQKTTLQSTSSSFQSFWLLCYLLSGQAGHVC